MFSGSKPFALNFLLYPSLSGVDKFLKDLGFSTIHIQLTILCIYPKI